MVNAQEWLDKEYPLVKRGEITELKICFENLEGELKLLGFSALESVNFSYNKLTNLKFADLPNLTKINCYDNLLESLELEKCDPKKLTYLNISKNSFSRQNLDYF